MIVRKLRRRRNQSAAAQFHVVCCESMGRYGQTIGLLLTLTLPFPPAIAREPNLQTTRRYRDLKKIVDRNAGHAHGTRGVNMYTLVALRTCVTEKDIAILAGMLAKDPDQIARMAAARVLADLGTAGKQAVQQQLQRTTEPPQRSILMEALSDSAAPGYRSLLDYPLTPKERNRLRGCPAKPR